MTSDCKKPGVVVWVTVMVVVLIVYVLSAGPALWIVSQDWSPDWALQVFNVLHFPVGYLDDHGPQPVRQAIDWYADLWK